MADNRMYIRCRGCGKTKLLAKCYGSVYNIYDTEAMNDFMARHAFCYEGDNEHSHEEKFDVFYESEDRFSELYNPEE